MSYININEQIIIADASPVENKVMARITNILRENFAIANEQGKLHEFLRDLIFAIIAINKKLGIIRENEFESEFKARKFVSD